MVSTYRCFYDSMDVDDNMVDKYCRACGKRIIERKPVKKVRIKK